MRVVITRAAGFLGRRLARTLLERGTLRGRDGQSRAIERLTLVDVAAGADVPNDPRVETVTGDLADPSVVRRGVGPDTSAVFHLAAVVSSMAEAEFDLGMRINVDATRLLLDVCRAHATRPQLIFTSSVAVFGGDLPHTVLDTTAVAPQSSYGTQKAIAELLISDYTRRGFVDGRVLRLPTVAVRPGRPNAAASSFASGILREPLNGDEAVCPVAPDTRLWLISPKTAVACLIAGHDVPAGALGHRPVINVPGLSITPGGMVSALERLAGSDAARRVKWQPDPGVERIVGTWPGAWDTTRAQALGFPADQSFDAIIEQYIAEELGPDRLSTR
jgi:nucleoside-diphosphate-sugar epimerase